MTLHYKYRTTVYDRDGKQIADEFTAAVTRPGAANRAMKKYRRRGAVRVIASQPLGVA